VAVGGDPSNRRAPIGVKTRMGTAMMVLIEMNNRAIATVRRIIHTPGRGVLALAPVFIYTALGQHV